jgi:hypothetical protein
MKCGGSHGIITDPLLTGNRLPVPPVCRRPTLPGERAAGGAATSAHAVHVGRQAVAAPPVVCLACLGRWRAGRTGFHLSHPPTERSWPSRSRSAPAGGTHATTRTAGRSSPGTGL